jgi:Fic family protein
MSFQEKIHLIDSLQSSIQEHGSIPAALLNKINYKLRLEWNYTSNSMEGNSLTKRETRTVMVNAIDVNGKPLKDIQEIKNHDIVINTIMKMGKGELNISESRIKEIHKGIMYEEDLGKQSYIGKWKNVDNYMTNFDGERYDFVSHMEVPERMHHLVNWVNSENERIKRGKKDALHPALLAFRFHLDYLAIHPFYDGNGRTARILSNLILISYGLPPLYIKEAEKQNYYRYLTDIQTYGGEPDLFYEFMAQLLIRSLQITLDSIEGKEIEEEDDFIKEIELLKAKSSVKDKPKSPQVLYNTYGILETELWHKIKNTLHHFNSLFNEFDISNKINNQTYKEITSPFRALDLVKIFDGKKKIFGVDVYEGIVNNIEWNYKLFALNGTEVPEDFKISLNVYFNALDYEINLTATGKTASDLIYKMQKKYEEAFSLEQIDDLLTVLKSHLLDEIKKRTNSTATSFETIMQSTYFSII